MNGSEDRRNAGKGDLPCDDMPETNIMLNQALPWMLLVVRTDVRAESEYRISKYTLPWPFLNTMRGVLVLLHPTSPYPTTDYFSPLTTPPYHLVPLRSFPNSQHYFSIPQIILLLLHSISPRLSSGWLHAIILTFQFLLSLVISAHLFFVLPSFLFSFLFEFITL